MNIPFSNVQSLLSGDIGYGFVEESTDAAVLSAPQRIGRWRSDGSDDRVVLGQILRLVAK